MSMIDKIFEAGIVGCGGAGFPTHVKLNCSVPYLIINGAECEPLLHTDRWILCNKATEVLMAIAAVGEAVKAHKWVIALKSTYTEEIASLEAAISTLNVPVQLYKMDAYYPAGDEQQIVYEVTGKVVPPGGIPLDVGSVVSNVATMLCIYDAIRGQPFTRKYLTVTGEVARPTVIHVPIGTSFSHCIQLAGGALQERYFVIAGGPMMGTPMTMEQADSLVVTKTTSGIILLKEDSYLSNHSAIDMRHTINRARSVCIQCSNCTQLCPRYLLGHPLEPHRIMRQLAMGGDISAMLNDPYIRQAQICCECGVCEHIACPMELQPCTVNKMLKRELAKAGVRYKKEEEKSVPNPFREERKVPTSKAASRAGVSQYYNFRFFDFVEDTPDRVSIPLKMHIGASPLPLVSTGTRVQAGQLIAKCPDGTLGANVHASINGEVYAVGERIVIIGGDRQ